MTYDEQLCRTRHSLVSICVPVQMVLLAGGLERSQALEGEVLQVVVLSALLPLTNKDSVSFGTRQPWTGVPAHRSVAVGPWVDA